MKNLIIKIVVIITLIQGVEAYSQENINKATKSDPNVPIFEIKNDAGQTVFAVYPSGVKIFIDTQLKATGGGFTVGRLGTGKATGDDFLIVNPGDVRINISSPLKATGGGFTVGRLGTGKASSTDNFLSITPDSSRIYVNETSTDGFAVGKLGTTGVGVSNFLDLTPENYFIGHQAGAKTTGLYNLFLGYQSGLANLTGESNTFIGFEAGYSNTSGLNNVFIGKQAGYSNINSDYNTYIGYQAGYNAFASSYNTAVGYQAGYSATNWQGGTFLGFEAGKFTTGRQNVFLGAGAGRGFTSGGDNVCIGGSAGGSNDFPFVEATGTENIFIGYHTGYKSGTATHNVIVGGQDPFGVSTITGSYNVYLGEDAGNQSGSASRNVFLGYNAGKNETTSDKLYIDNTATASPLVYGDFNSNDLKFNANVGINYAASDLWGLTIGLDANDTYGLVVYGPTFCSSGAWAASDFRFKKNIVTLNSALDKILQLRGVSFEWKAEEFPDKGFTHGENVGFIAQEVEKIIPDLVQDGPGGYKSIAYDKLTAFIVEAMKEQQTQIESSKSENIKLTSRVQELETKNMELSTEISKLSELKSEVEELKNLVNELKNKN